MWALAHAILLFFLIVDGARTCASFVYGGTGNQRRSGFSQRGHERLQKGIQAAVQPRVDMQSLQEAIEGLKDGSIVLPGPNMALTRGTKTLSAAELLWNGYMRTLEDPSVPQGSQVAMRELCLLLLRQGLNASATFELGQHRQAGNLAGTPLGYLTRQMDDPEFMEAWLEAGHPTRGTIVHIPPKHLWGKEGYSVVGASYLHFVANSGLEVRAIRDFYKLFACLERARPATIGGRGGGSDRPRSDNDHRRDGTLVSDAEFERCLHTTMLAYIVPYSEAAQEIVAQLREGVPLTGRNMSYQWAERLDCDLHVYVLRSLFRSSPDFDWTELILDVPIEPINGQIAHANPVILATSLGKSGVLEALVETINDLQQRSIQEYEFAREMLRIALGASTKYRRRTALHLGALRRGKKSRLWNALLAAEQLASGNLDRLRTLEDAFGRTPDEYDGPGSTETRLSAAMNLSHGGAAQHSTSYAASNTEHPLFADVPTLLERVNVGADGSFSTASTGVSEKHLNVDEGIASDLSRSADDNGGWGNGGTRGNSGPRSDDNFRCDVSVYEGMPSRAQLISIIERNEPSLFRGAVANWTFRKAWQKQNFLAKYNSTMVDTSEIPYALGFDANAANERITMGEYVAKWGSGGNDSPSGAPMYLFGSEYTDQNPDLRAEVEELIDLLGTETSVDSLREMSPQFFLGPAASGAPMHWHNTALNALAYGEKKWFLLPPSSTYYSVLPSERFAHEEVPELEADGNEVGLLQCTQQAGDLIFVGESFGHATFNAKPSIGFAMEFYLRDLDISVNVPPFEADVSRQKGTDQLPAAGRHRSRGDTSSDTGGRQNRRKQRNTGRVASRTPNQPYMLAARRWR
eukprot:INCI2536.1.p1 GENE.INCI2536.1~~INCI2536.1.p1  ORF type:complete len:861 (-),score=142.45 INCI2536.1:19-2601(-)